MASYNKVTLVGNLTRDPEMKSLPSGKSVCEFGLALNRKWTGQDGQQKDEVVFLDVSAWGRTGELVAQYLKKGSSALVDGRISQDRWQDKTTGQNRSRLYITAERVVFLGGKNGGQGGSTAAAGYGGERETVDDVPF